ncbi:MAG: DUF58 domain-containing protein [Ilumatobacteraceae bacterium]
MLTRSGVGALVAAVLLGGCGWWWHYEEMIVLAAGIGGLVLMAVWAAQRPFRVSIQRRLTTPRVARGDPIPIVYRIVNDTNHRSGRADIGDHCAGAAISVTVEPLGKHEAVELSAEIPTRRRGIFEVGPWSIERIDPFGLAIGHRDGESTATVIVHPRIYDLLGPHGSMQTVESEALIRRTASDPLSGFMSLREYVDGDDPRLIHWPTTARTGTLMVKEHVELRRPEFTVVLDTADHVGTPDDFEEAVDVAASVAVHAVRSGLDVVVRTTSREHPGIPVPRTSESQIVDLLTPVQQGSEDDLLPVAALFRAGLDHAAIVIVTGPDGPSSRLASSEHMLAVRIGYGAQAGQGIALAATDAREFTQRWKPWS